MTLDEAVKKFESGFDVLSSVGYPVSMPESERDWSRAPNGEYYVSLTSSGPKEPGEMFSAFFASQDLAVAAWAAEADKFAAEHLGPVIYWRDRPQLVDIAALKRRDGLGPFTVWVVFCRLAIGSAAETKAA
jgi:hypothetical protein